MFDYNALKHPLKAEGHDLWLFSHLLPDDIYKKLKAVFPVDGFVSEPYRPDNPNSNAIRFAHFDNIEIKNIDDFKAITLDSLWSELYQTLISKKYLEIISDLTHFDLSNIDLHLWFVRYHPNGYLSAHYDRRPNKILTQVFYFNEDWIASEGGSFDLLTKEEPRNKIFSVIPDRIYSALMKCNPNAWHEVTPVKGLRSRLTVTLEYMIK